MSTAIDTIRRDAAVSYRQPDGTLQILNFRFGHGSRHTLLHRADAPARIVTLARDLVSRHVEAQFRRSLLHSAFADACPMRSRLFAEDVREADELLMIATGRYRSALREVHPYAVLCVDGHAVYREVEGDRIHVDRLDGRQACGNCRGCGRTRAADAPIARPCGLCKGSGVSVAPATLPACIRDAIDAKAAEPDVAWHVRDLDDVPSADLADPAAPYQRFVDSLRPAEF